MVTEHAHLRVEVPTAAGGLMLVERLGHGFALAGSEEDGWLVAGSADGDLPAALATIQRWLHDEATDQVTVHVGEHTHHMKQE